MPGCQGQNGQPLQNAPEEGAEGSMWLGEAQVALSIQRYAETKVWGSGRTEHKAQSQGPPQAGCDHSSKEREQRAQSSLTTVINCARWAVGRWG